MRHQRNTKRLGRNRAERKALVENLVMSLLNYQQIKTTLPKAKVAKRLADRVIQLGKTDTLSARRRVFSYLQDHTLTSRLFKEVAPRFKSRNGGYTRILQLQRRKGDGAQMALLELTEKEIKVKETKKTAKKNVKPEKGHEGHEHGAEGHEHTKPDTHFQKHPEGRPEKPGKGGFFKDLGKFFRNKGGG